MTPQVVFISMLSRKYLEKNQAKDGITSEALQPIYELKHVAERSSKSSEEVLAKLSTVSSGMV